MNQKKPYEQLIAEKLRRLPAPDADASWQKMKQLLDDNNPDIGGIPNNKPGNNNWWRTAIVALLFIGAILLYTENNKNVDNTAFLAKQNTNNTVELDTTTALKQNKIKLTTIDKTTTLKKLALKDNLKNSLIVNNKIVSSAIKHKSKPAIKTNYVVSKKAKLNKVINVNDVHLINSNQSLPIAFSSANNMEQNNNIKLITVPKIKLKKRKTSNVLDSSTFNADKNTNIVNYVDDNVSNSNNNKLNTVIAKTSYNRTEKRVVNENNLQNIPSFSITNYVKTKDGYKTIITEKISSKISVANKQSYFERLEELRIPYAYEAINTDVLVVDSLCTNLDTSNLLSGEAKSLIVKAQKAKAREIAINKKTRRSFNLNLSNVFKPFSLKIDAEPWWAAGLALNNVVAVNIQNRYNYNVNAKSGVVTDYIPSPFVQFHLNNSVYMQTELNINTPQLTPQLLLYQKTTDIAGTGGASLQKSIYIQKLYYFNWPVSLHYSPINNLYFAAGIQFSSFQSGLALIQNKRYASGGLPVSIDNTIQKFKDDSLAAKLAPTEWRWQTGADYYWNRFTIGLRYNKAFKDLVNVTISNTLPTTSSRNTAFLFFMRYNLFEGRNKERGNNSLKNLVRY